MTFFLGALSYIGAVFGLGFMTLCLACGLYYLAELVEEYTVATKKIIKYATTASIIAHLVLLIGDRMSPIRILFSIACHLWYSQLLPEYPYIELSSPAFVISVVLVITDHLIWFFYFSKHYFTILEIGTFFGLLVWAVPFMYFLSLSANEYTLPAFDPTAQRRASMQAEQLSVPKRRQTNLVKSFLGVLQRKKEEIMPVGGSKTF
ncbi:erv26 super protein [Rhizophlyctis rosea]|uniref:Erv26 super protein n=1 Tax=Rhizophlyctis rosea TaxID=64517 RepID=A0AAD5SA09_9FUNG|nr:erv26 super protein [Rhizophlyctis rosea]